MSRQQQESASNLGRRSFLKLAGIAGGGLVVGVSLNGCSSSAPLPYSSKDAWQPDAFLQMTTAGQVKFFLPQAEMGQGVTHGLTTLVAEELNMPPSDIDVTVAGVHKDYHVPGAGMQITGGSASMRTRYEGVRQSAATMRTLILQAAAQQWDLPITDLVLRDGKVSHGDQVADASQFIATAMTLPSPEQVTLKDEKDFRWIGKSNQPRVDALAKVTGTAEFGIDVNIPNLKRAALLRCPVIGGSVKSFNSNGAEKALGVHQVLSIYNGVAVLADHYWQAKKALESIEVEWDLPETLSSHSSADIYQAMAEGLSEEGENAFEQGDVAQAFDQAESTLSARYQAPFLAHATMEPMNCVVHLQGDRAEVWAPTQAPGLAQQIAAEHSGLDRDTIQVHTPFLGGGFGRRAFHDFVAETTAIAKATGVPVQLVWSREDDTQNDYYRPAAMADFEAGVDASGLLNSWRVKRSGPNIMPYMIDEALGMLLPEAVPQSISEWLSKRGYGVFDSWQIDPASVEGLHEDYAVANKRVDHVTVDPGLRCGYWRSVGHSFSGFFVESFMDELALKTSQDPLEFRLRHMDDNPRLKHVLQLAAKQAGWGQPKPGRFLGLAAVKSFESYVAEVAEISVENQQIKVHKVTCAVDCGRVVNPDMVRTQMESGINYGLTAALFGDITIENGAVKESNFDDYRILRMNEAPEIDVILVDSKEPPTGVGEPGLPPIAPAVANAVFAATGQRLRSLPLKLT